MSSGSMHVKIYATITKLNLCRIYKLSYILYNTFLNNSLPILRNSIKSPPNISHNDDKIASSFLACI